MSKCKAKLNDGSRCNKEISRGRKFCRMHANPFFKIKQTTYAIGKTIVGALKPAPLRYHEYIQSDQWKERAAKERQEQPNCSLCHRKGILHVHHSTYVRLGNEAKSDLVVLCDDCHALFHRFYEYDGRVGHFNPANKLKPRTNSIGAKRK